MSRLLAPGSGSTNQIAEQNCQLENELISTDYTSKVGEKQFLDVQKGRKSTESKIEVHCGRFAGQARSPYLTAPSLHDTNYGHGTQQSCRCLKDERNCR